MKRRVFLAINLPEEIKKRLEDYRDKFDFLFTRRSLGGGGLVRWTKKDSLHLTLVFIGYVTNEQMLEICRVTRQAAAESKAFFINFKKILLGPPNRLPRMIWLEGTASQELTELKNKLEKALLESETGFFRAENRLFKPHITLARIKHEQWRQMGETPAIEENFETRMPVDSIEVMESDLKRDGAEYAVLESCSLSGEN